MRWALVTGGAKRLGAQLCLDLAAKGYSVLIHYHTSRKEAEEVAENCRSLGAQAEIFQGDFSTSAGVDEFIRVCHVRSPSIEILINNVGSYLIKPASVTTLEEWNAIFQSNVHTPFALCRAFLPSLCQNHGSIINIGVAGINNIHANTYSTAYMTAKMSLLMLTKSLAKEMAPKGVRINMVSPGYMEDGLDLPKEVDRLPMKRLAAFSEVSRVITDLLEPQSSYITGQNIEVAGGVRL